MAEEIDQRKIAHDYAWSWFEYHAGQRMSVFRFYLVFVALLAGGIIRTFEIKMFGATTLLGLTLAVFSYLFMRLDLRSADLIKISERHLQISETELAKTVGSSIEFTRMAGAKNNDFATIHSPNFLFSFRVVFTLIFWLGVAGGLFSCGVAWYAYDHLTVEKANETLVDFDKNTSIPKIIPTPQAPAK